MSLFTLTLLPSPGQQQCYKHKSMVGGGGVAPLPGSQSWLLCTIFGLQSPTAYLSSSSPFHPIPFSICPCSTASNSNRSTPACSPILRKRSRSPTPQNQDGDTMVEKGSDHSSDKSPSTPEQGVQRSCSSQSGRSGGKNSKVSWTTLRLLGGREHLPQMAEGPPVSWRLSFHEMRAG